MNEEMSECLLLMTLRFLYLSYLNIINVTMVIQTHFILVWNDFNLCNSLQFSNIYIHHFHKFLHFIYFHQNHSYLLLGYENSIESTEGSIKALERHFIS